ICFFPAVLSGTCSRPLCVVSIPQVLVWTVLITDARDSTYFSTSVQLVIRLAIRGVTLLKVLYSKVLRETKQFEKVYGFQPTPRSEERIKQAIENELRSREVGEDFFIDN